MSRRATGFLPHTLLHSYLACLQIAAEKNKVKENLSLLSDVLESGDGGLQATRPDAGGLRTPTWGPQAMPLPVQAAYLPTPGIS
jgi:hypothetical protein